MIFKRTATNSAARAAASLILVLGCGASNDGGNTGGVTGSGGATASGGQSSGGTSNPASGGQSSGGASNPTSGGVSQGGVSQGGVSQGGSTQGGAATSGGSSSGGQVSAGGSSMGGAKAMGGAATGGSTSSGAGTVSSGGSTSGSSSTGGSKATGGGGAGGQVSGGKGGVGGGGKGGAGGSTSMGGTVTGGSTSTGGASSSTDPCIGWASVNAEGVARTTGGDGGPVVQITTAEQLTSYRRDPAPMILRIMNNLTGEFELGSNKTVEGANANITINGSLSFSGTTTTTLSNLIVRNLRVNAVTSGEDGMDIRFAHHVCVHHCEFIDGPDGNLDVVSEANYVTIAYNKFRYTAAWRPLPGETATNHRFSNLVGSSNTTEADRGKLKVTFHHNWWAEGVIERMPRVRFGDVHVFNNYYSSMGNSYCVAGGKEARLVVENNFFENVVNPHIFYDGDTTAQIKASGNEYVNATGTQDSGQGAAFTPPYPYTLDAAASVKANVMANVGPR
jgi:pectate lyase